VDGSAVHAVIVGGSVIVRDIGAVAYHRVDGEPVHPSMMSVKRGLRSRSSRTAFLLPRWSPWSSVRETLASHHLLSVGFAYPTESCMRAALRW